MSTARPTKTTIDRATHTITFQRTFAAPREDVFEAWTRPEQLTQWWDPTGTPLTECAIDLRPGGAFKFVNQDSAHGPPFAGVYRVIEAPSLLVFDALGALGTVRLETDRDATNMTLTIRCGSAEHLEQFVKLGVDVGTDRTLDNLVAHVARAR
ncbi:MAG: SRPBCC domain-containing protein [Deltaproteobacteria bacterium]|nr:SRPBCC domain-containing protein [Deltaproteobacteria bacterium]